MSKNALDFLEPGPFYELGLSSSAGLTVYNLHCIFMHTLYTPVLNNVTVLQQKGWRTCSICTCPGDAGKSGHGSLTRPMNR